MTSLQTGSTRSTPAQRGREEAGESVGQRLRALRMSAGLSIRALAEASRLNVNTLSLIENGRTSPSVSTLQQAAAALGVPITAFFESGDGDCQAVFQRASERPRTAFAHGWMEDLGAGMPRFGAEPLLITLEPAADSGRTPIVHTGREFVYCLEGEIVYSIGEEIFRLAPGDSLLFEAFLPHRWRNVGDGPAKALLVLCPMDTRDRPTERHFARS